MLGQIHYGNLSVETSNRLLLLLKRELVAAKWLVVIPGVTRQAGRPAFLFAEHGAYKRNVF